MLLGLQSSRRNFLVGAGRFAGAAAAVLNAVNDALALIGASVNTLPITPERVLAAIDQVTREDQQAPGNYK